jgi:hypothetical protein
MVLTTAIHSPHHPKKYIYRNVPVSTDLVSAVHQDPKKKNWRIKEVNSS